MLLAILHPSGDVQLFDSRKTPIMFICDESEREAISNVHARSIAQGFANQAHWAAPDYPNTETGLGKRHLDQQKMIGAMHRHETFKSYVGEDPTRQNGESNTVFVPRTKIITPA